MSQVTFLKKMTVKEMGCRAVEARDSKYRPGAVGTDGVALATGGQHVPLCIIYGRVGEVKYVDSKFSGEPEAGFIGTFEAVNLQNVEDNKSLPPDKQKPTHFQSGKLYVPGGFGDMLEGAYKSVEATGGSIEFAVKLLARYDEASNVGYRYAIQNLRDAAPTDDLAGIRGLIQGKVEVPLGPAPETAAPALPPPTQIDAAHAAAGSGSGTVDAKSSVKKK